MMTTTVEAEPVTAVDDAPPAPPASGRRAVALRRTGAVLLVLAVLVGAWLVRAERTALTSEADDREAVVETSVTVAKLLLALSGESGRTTIERLEQHATGPLAEQVDALGETLAGVLEQGDVESQGVVQAAGVEKLTADTAEVIVASRSFVSNAELPDGELRNFRMVVSLQRVGDAWKASGVEFLS